MLPTIATGNVASATAGGYEVANSCMFNDGDSAYMTTTGLSTPTSKRAATFSFWIKRGNLGINTAFFGGESDSNDYGQIGFDSSDNLQCYIEINGSTELNLITSAVYRDSSAWYHFALIIDGSQATPANRAKLYVNGTQVTAFGTSDYMNQNTDLAFLETHLPANAFIGVRKQAGSLSRYFDGYIAEAVYLDGTIAAIGDLGEFDSDSPTIWKPKDVSGLTFGNNGFYLDFEDSGDLDDDESGNGNDFTASNLAATDQALDSPTNNWCTMNPLNVPTSNPPPFEQGNLKTTSPGSGSNILKFGGTSTIGMTQGKWYLEAKATVDGTYSRNVIGITGEASSCASLNRAFDLQTNSCFGYGSEGGDSISNNSTASYGNTYTTGDIIGVAIDLDNMKLYFSKNGTWQNSGNPESGATGTGAISISTALASTTDGIYFVMQGDNTGSSANSIFEFNFGSPIYTISSSNADGNGYGNMEYAVPANYYLLNTKNLAEYG